MTFVSVRPAIKEDCPTIYKCIEESGRFAQKTGRPLIDVETLERDGFTETPFFKCVVAEDSENASHGQTGIVGYAFYFYIYSTWEGKALFMEDIYVKPTCRKRGFGTTLLRAVVQDGLDNGCCRVDATALEDNTLGMRFMKKYGATDLTEQEDWHLFRLTKEAMIDLVAK